VVKIVIENLAQKEVLISDPSQSLLTAFQEASIDWMHACGGKGRCTTCRFKIVEGKDNLAPLTNPELKYRMQGRLLEDERLACQARAVSDCRVAVPEACKLPHMRYSD
jgi:2Fe-2S ferredoxin